MRPVQLAPLLALLVTACDSWPGVGGDGGIAPCAYHMEDNSGNLGSSCGTTVKCNLQYICVPTAPNGLCTKTCSSDADCSNYGASCVNAFGGFICVKNCQSDQMCREGYACLSTGTAKVCLKDNTVVADK